MSINKWVHRCLAIAVSGVFSASLAQAYSVTVNSDVQTYVNSVESTTNYSNKGGVEIGNNPNQNGIEEAFFSFNTSSIVNQLNMEYGANDWTITSASVTLTSNYASSTGTQPSSTKFNNIAAGGFQFSFLNNNTWNLGTALTSVNYSNSSTYLGTNNSNLQSLGTYTYSANGASPQTLAWALTGNPGGVTTGLLADIASGGEISIFGSPTAGSKVGYEFGTSTGGTPPILTITAEAATPTPIPAAVWLLGSGLFGLVGLKRRQHPAVL